MHNNFYNQYQNQLFGQFNNQYQIPYFQNNSNYSAQPKIFSYPPSGYQMQQYQQQIYQPQQLYKYPNQPYAPFANVLTQNPIITHNQYRSNETILVAAERNETELLRNFFNEIAGEDQRISRSEFYRLFSQLFQSDGSPLFQIEASSMFDAIDLDKNGYIDFNEFYLAYKEAKRDGTL